MEINNNENNNEIIVSKLLLNKLLKTKSLTFLSSNNLKEIISFTFLKELIIKELNYSQGRITLNELQIILDIDKAFIDQVIPEIINQNNSQYHLIGGELISSEYFIQLAKEINLTLHSIGSISFGSLSLKFQLPLDLISDIVKLHLGTIIIGTLKNNTLYSENHFEKQYAILRGTCRGCVTPISISQLTSLTNGLDESSVSKYISELIQKEVIHGTCTAKEFVPSIFKLHQRVEVDEYFKLYGLIELNKLTSTYKVSGKLIDFIRTSFPDAIQLVSCIISRDHFKSLEREIHDLIAAIPQENHPNDDNIKWNGTGGIPWLHIPSFYPSGLPIIDEESYLSNLFQLSSIKKNQFVEINSSNGIYLLNQNFYSWIQKQIYLDGQQLEIILLTHFKSQIEKSLSVSSISVSSKGVQQSTTHKNDDYNYDYDDDEGNGKGRKGNKKSKKSKNNDDNDYEQQQQLSTLSSSNSNSTKGSSGKKSSSTENKKKNSSQKSNQSSINNSNLEKSNQHSSTSSSISNNVNTVLAPYIEDHRMIGLIRKCFQPIVDFTEGRIRSNSNSEDLSGSDDENNENDDNKSYSDEEIQALYVSLWELLKESTIESYKKIANKAKDEASKGGITDRMKKEQERDKKFEFMWNELQVIIKGLGTIENRSSNEINPAILSKTIPIHQLLLSTRCSKIVELLTIYACWENGVEFQCFDNNIQHQHHQHQNETDESKGSNNLSLDHEEEQSLRSNSSYGGKSQVSSHSKRHTETISPFITSDDKLKLQQILPREVSSTILKLWHIVLSSQSTVWDFIDYLDQCISQGSLQLVGHKLDKKKERTISFTMKQNVLNQLNQFCNDDQITNYSNFLTNFCILGIYQFSGTIVELPDLLNNLELLEYIIIWFRTNEVFQDEEIEKIKLLKVSHVENEIFEEIKSLVLKKK